MSKAVEKVLLDRIDWLKQKLQAQRTVGGPEYTPQQLLIGRTEGNIGALEWALREFKELAGDPPAFGAGKRKKKAALGNPIAAPISPANEKAKP